MRQYLTAVMLTVCCFVRAADPTSQELEKSLEANRELKQRASRLAREYTLYLDSLSDPVKTVAAIVGELGAARRETEAQNQSPTRDQQKIVALSERLEELSHRAQQILRNTGYEKNWRKQCLDSLNRAVRDYDKAKENLAGLIIASDTKEHIQRSDQIVRNIIEGRDTSVEAQE
jgi:hypothetical protein